MDRGMGNENYKRLGRSIGMLEWGWMIHGGMVVLWYVFYLHDEYGCLGWLNGVEKERPVIVRNGEWNEWTWIRGGGISIVCYVWSVRREWLIQYEEKSVVGYWIWLECIDGCQWRRMKSCGWGLRGSELYAVSTWIWRYLAVKRDSGSEMG